MSTGSFTSLCNLFLMCIQILPVFSAVFGSSLFSSWPNCYAQSVFHIAVWNAWKLDNLILCFRAHFECEPEQCCSAMMEFWMVYETAYDGESPDMYHVLLGHAYKLFGVPEAWGVFLGHSVRVSTRGSAVIMAVCACQLLWVSFVNWLIELGFAVTRQTYYLWMCLHITDATRLCLPSLYLGYQICPS